MGSKRLIFLIPLAVIFTGMALLVLVSQSPKR